MLETIPLKPEPSWQEELRDVISDPAELLRLLDLPAEALANCSQPVVEFPLRVPRPYLSRINHSDPNDPLLRQVLPLAAEMETAYGYTKDPLAEEHCNPQPGLLRKYHGRALLLVTSSCAIHCRYCFRRHFPYESNNPGKKQWLETLKYLAGDESITEVIFSGGDPLTAPDRYLSWLADELDAIPHIQRLRIHTRLPIMIPQRVDRELCDWLARLRMRTVVVLHSNHAREFDADVDAACWRLRQTGAILLNQSVLLKGINDCEHTLAGLSQRLFNSGVMPYYLHMLDRTQGTAHFEVNEQSALTLMARLQELLPGYLVPKLVREQPGMPSKTPLTTGPWN